MWRINAQFNRVWIAWKVPKFHFICVRGRDLLAPFYEKILTIYNVYEIISAFGLRLFNVNSWVKSSSNSEPKYE